MKCPKCGFENRPNLQFCEQCGEPLGQAGTVACAACGHPNAAGLRFCEECGKPLGQAGTVACLACGHSNAAGLRFCEECGKPLGKRRRPGLLARPIAFVRRRPLWAAGLVLALVALALGIDYLRHPVTRDEASSIAGAAVQLYDPRLAEVAPEVHQFQDEGGDTFVSYSYTKDLSVALEDGSTTQLTVGAVVVINRDTGEVQLITVR